MDLRIEKEGEVFRIYREIKVDKNKLQQFRDKIKNSIPKYKEKIEFIEKKKHLKQLQKELMKERKSVEKSIELMKADYKNLIDIINDNDATKLQEYLSSILKNTEAKIEENYKLLADWNGILKDELDEFDRRKQPELQNLKEELIANEEHLKAYNKALKKL